MRRRSAKNGGNILRVMFWYVLVIGTGKDDANEFVQSHPTEGLGHRVEPPFLTRWVSQRPDMVTADGGSRNLDDLPEDLPRDEFHFKSGLDIKIALGNYRMFFAPGKC
jgi:hypothetical protein